jgi:hypothetical protein
MLELQCLGGQPTGHVVTKQYFFTTKLNTVNIFITKNKKISVYEVLS